MNLEELKLKTEDYLQNNGIEINTNLPTIETLDEVNPVSVEKVACRVCALAYIVGIAYDGDRNYLIENLKKYNLWDSVTYKEKRMLEASDVSEEEKNWCGWLPESIQALAWCINLVQLDNFKNCDDDLAGKIPFKTDPSLFIKAATLRPINQIQEQSDILYRMHWYAVNSRINQIDTKIDEGSIQVRRQAIDWVYGVEEEWEDIPLDT